MHVQRASYKLWRHGAIRVDHSLTDLMREVRRDTTLARLTLTPMTETLTKLFKLSWTLWSLITVMMMMVSSSVQTTARILTPGTVPNIICVRREQRWDVDDNFEIFRVKRNIFLSILTFKFEKLFYFRLRSLSVCMTWLVYSLTRSQDPVSGLLKQSVLIQKRWEMSLYCEGKRQQEQIKHLPVNIRLASIGADGIGLLIKYLTSGCDSMS